MHTYLCLTNDFKGVNFIKTLKEAGNRVFVVTSENHKDKDWPREHMDDIFFVNEIGKYQLNYDDIMSGLSHFMRSTKIDRIIALDDFDVEKAANMREHFRIPGMGETTVRHFRDKLAMRMKAQEEGLKVPAFTALFNDGDINDFIQNVPAPWIVKPRSEAGAEGLKKAHNGDELWSIIHGLGDERHQYLVEQFKPGSVWHVDSLTVDGKPLFTRVSQYLNTPFEVMHGGGIFRSHVVEFGSADEKHLQKFNKEVLKGFGMKFGASHTEFIKADEDGEFYFLETSARVGGAHLAEMVEASSGISLWTEWAKIEHAMANDLKYKLPKVEKQYAGIVVSLSKFEHPDYQSFTDEEIVWKLNKKYHIGMIVKSKSRERVLELLDNYAGRIYHEFHAAG